MPRVLGMLLNQQDWDKNLIAKDYNKLISRDVVGVVDLIVA